MLDYDPNTFVDIPRRGDHRFRHKIDKGYGQTWRRKPLSLAPEAGRPTKGWKEQKG
jgi:hypothetical protein